MPGRGIRGLDLLERAPQVGQRRQEGVEHRRPGLVATQDHADLAKERRLDELLVRAQAAGHHSVIARITAPNVASLRLHARCGFRTIGLERETAFKLGRWLDVVVLQRPLAAR